MSNEKQDKYELRIIEKNAHRQQMISELEVKHGIKGKTPQAKEIEAKQKIESITESEKDVGK